MFDRMLRCCDELGKTLQPRLVLDCALIDVATLEPLVPLGDLLARLGELEARARSGGGGGQLPKKHDVSHAAPVKPAVREVSSVAPSVAMAAPTVVVVPPVQARPVVVAPSGPVPTLEKAAAGSGRHALPTNANDVLKEWEHVLSKLSGRNVTISGAYEPARVLLWTAERLELGFPAHFEANKELAEAKEKLEALAGVLLEEYGHTPKITIKSVDDAAPAARSVLEASRERSTAERSKRETEAREHPITKHVLQTFGAQIKEIKTDV
jgi:DNA polymerase-3 subunit gamma/tau